MYVPPAASAPSVRCTHRVVEERMEMDEGAAAVMNSGARAKSPCPGAGNRFALEEEFQNVKNVSEPPSPNVDDAPNEHPVVKGRLAQLEWEDRILLDQAIVTKQTILKHAEHICKLERTMRAICELILEARPNEEVPKPTGPTPELGLPKPPEVIMRRDSFCMPPPAPQVMVNPLTGLLPTPAILMAGEQFPNPPPAPQLLVQPDARHCHGHQIHHLHHPQHHHQHHYEHNHQHQHKHHHQHRPHWMARRG